MDLSHRPLVASVGSALYPREPAVLKSLTISGLFSKQHSLLVVVWFHIIIYVSEYIFLYKMNAASGTL